MLHARNPIKTEWSKLSYMPLWDRFGLESSVGDLLTAACFIQTQTVHLALPPDIYDL